MLSFNQSKQFIILAIAAALVVIGALWLNNYSRGKWVCSDDGLWVAEGKPEGPRPGLYCK